MNWKILCGKLMICAGFAFVCGWWATYLFEPVEALDRYLMYLVPAAFFGVGFLYDVVRGEKRRLPPVIAQIVMFEKGASLQEILSSLSPKQLSEASRRFAGSSNETQINIHRKRGHVSRWRSGFCFILINAFLLAIFLTMNIAGIWYFLPRKQQVEEIAEHLRLTLRKEGDGKIYVVSVVNDFYMSREKISKHVYKAVLTREDQRFYSHPGVDWRGLLRVIRHMGQRGGASTIHQQLARSLLLSREGNVFHTIRRKFKEAIFALKLNRYYLDDKDKILEMYLNNVYFGEGNAPERDFPQSIYGIEMASQLYFNKAAAALEAYEAAILAQSLTGPNAHNCVADRRRTENSPETQARVPKQTRDLLQKMRIAVQEAELSQAIDRCVRYGRRRLQTLEIPEYRYLLNWILPQIRQSNDFAHIEGEFTVVTTLNAKVQRFAQEAIATQFRKYVKNGVLKTANLPQVALVALTPDGAVRAIMGGREYTVKDQYRRVILAKRQPGSTFKLFVYLTALEQGWTSEQRISDRQQQNWKNGKPGPVNWQRNYLKNVSLLEAFKDSRNAAAVNLLQQVGNENVKSLARKLGIQSDFLPEPGLSLALGVREVTPLEMTAAYTVFANGGFPVKPYGVLEVHTSGGNIRYRYNPDQPQQIVDKSVVIDINRMLEAVVKNGTGKKAKLGRHIAGGKTGTTQGNSDAWFIGCTAYLCTGVWVGHDKSTLRMPDKVNGGTLPAEIFHDFMQMTHTALQLEPRELP